MKKLFTCISGLFLFFSHGNILAQSGDTLGVTKDTEPSFAPNNISYLLKYKPPGSVSDSGFVFGTLYTKSLNIFGFSQAYTNFDTVEVVKILSFPRYKRKGPSNTPETKITYRLHKIDPKGAFSNPQTGDQGQGPAAASLALKDQLFADIDTTSGSYNVVTLDAPVKYNAENIVISVDCSNLKPAGDTLCFLSDQPGSGLNLNYNCHWLLLSGSKIWVWSNPLFVNNLNNNVAVFPVLKGEGNPTSINKTPYFQGVKAVLMPNPANDISILQYDVKFAGKYIVEIISNDGKLISSQELGYRTTGQHQTEINVAHLSAGNYMYSIVNAEAGIRYTKSMVVAH